MGQKTVQLRIAGQVQGVGFRDWTQRNARARGLTGWVRNEADGTVSALISGPEAAVDGMVDAVREGPPGADVTDVSSAEAAPTSGEGFEIAG